MDTRVKKIIDLAKDVMSIESTTGDKEYELTSILHEELVSGNREVFDKAMQASPNMETELFLNSFANNLASTKTLQKKDKNVVESNLFAIPIIAIQSEKDINSRISDDDLQSITNILKEFNVADENVVPVFLQKILTPQAVFVDGFSINEFHDCIIRSSTGLECSSLYPYVTSVVNQDTNLFPVKEETMVMRYIVGSFIGKHNKYFDNLDNIIEVFNLQAFVEKMDNVLSNYFSGKATALIPLPYNEGIESGIIEYNATAALHTFIYSIEQLNLSSSLTRLEIDEIEDNSIKLRLINKTNNMLIALYEWNIPFLSDTMMSNVMQSINEICEELGLPEYTMRQENDDRAKHVVH